MKAVAEEEEEESDGGGQLFAARLRTPKQCKV
jgi:hypothetical protein